MKKLSIVLAVLLSTASIAHADPSSRLQLSVPPLGESAELLARGTKMRDGGIALSISGTLLAVLGGFAIATARPDRVSCSGGSSSSSSSSSGESDALWTWLILSSLAGAGPGSHCHTVHDDQNEIGAVVVGLGVVTAGVGIVLVVAGEGLRGEAAELEHASGRATRATPYLAPRGDGVEAGVRIEGF